MSAFYVTTPINNKPSTFENDLQRMVYDNLSKLGIEFSRVENEPAVTMEDCKNIDEAFGIETIKTIFLTNRQKTKFYLLVMPADKLFVTKDFGEALQIPRVSFANEELLYSILGTPHGAASPLSVIMDVEQKVSVIIDKDISMRDKIVCTDGTLHAFVCLKSKDLIERYLTYLNHYPIIIDL